MRPIEKAPGIVSMLDVAGMPGLKQAIKKATREEIDGCFSRLHEAERICLEKGVSFRLGQLDYKDRDSLFRLFRAELSKRDRLAQEKIDKHKQFINEFGVVPHGKGKKQEEESGKERRRGARVRRSKNERSSG